VKNVSISLNEMERSFSCVVQEKKTNVPMNICVKSLTRLFHGFILVHLALVHGGIK